MTAYALLVLPDIAYLNNELFLEHAWKKPFLQQWLEVFKSLGFQKAQFKKSDEVTGSWKSTRTEEGTPQKHIRVNVTPWSWSAVLETEGGTDYNLGCEGVERNFLFDVSATPVPSKICRALEVLGFKVESCLSDELLLKPLSAKNAKETIHVLEEEILACFVKSYGGRLLKPNFGRAKWAVGEGTVVTLELDTRLIDDVQQVRSIEISIDRPIRHHGYTTYNGPYLPGVIGDLLENLMGEISNNAEHRLREGLIRLWEQNDKQDVARFDLQEFLDRAGFPASEGPFDPVPDMRDKKIEELCALGWLKPCNGHDNDDFEVIP